MDWTHTSLLHHLHLPFPFSVYFRADVHRDACVEDSRGYSVETLHGFRISSMVASRPPVS